MISNKMYLYVKRHKVTGLKYFGLTRQEDPYKYRGSGIYWRKHIKKYGDEYVETIQLWEFSNQDECSIFANQFSRENDIVNSLEWANLIEETGSWNLPLHENVRLSTRDKISAFRKQHVGWKHSDITKTRMAKARKKFHEKNKTNGEVWMKAAIEKAHERVHCLFCSRLISRCNLERHTKNCNSNPERQPVQTKNCPHCDKNIDFRNYARYHGDKCKHSTC